MNIVIRLMLLFMLFLTSQSGIAATTKFTEHQYDVNHVALSEEIYGYYTTSNIRHCCLSPSAGKTQDRSFLEFVSDFFVTKGGLDNLLRAGRQVDKNGLTKAGRGLQKHGDRRWKRLP